MHREKCEVIFTTFIVEKHEQYARFIVNIE